MPRDFATEFATFSLDMHHIYKMNIEEFHPPRISLSTLYLFHL
jgi:hypothetical protein